MITFYLPTLTSLTLRLPLCDLNSVLSSLLYKKPVRRLLVDKSYVQNQNSVNF